MIWFIGFLIYLFVGWCILKVNKEYWSTDLHIAVILTVAWLPLYVYMALMGHKR